MKKNFKILIMFLIVFALMLSACGEADTTGGTDATDKTGTPTGDAGTAKTKTKTKTKTAAPAETAPDKIYPMDQPAPEAPAEHVLVVKVGDSETTLTREDILALEDTKDYGIETHVRIDGALQPVTLIRKGISVGDLLKSQGYDGNGTELYMGGIGSEPARKPMSVIGTEKAIVALSTDGNWNDPAGKSGTLQFVITGMGSPAKRLEAEDGTKSPVTINNVNYIEVK